MCMHTMCVCVCVCECLCNAIAPAQTHRDIQIPSNNHKRHKPDGSNLNLLRLCCHKPLVRYHHELCNACMDMVPSSVLPWHETFSFHPLPCNGIASFVLILMQTDRHCRAGFSFLVLILTIWNFLPWFWILWHFCLLLIPQEPAGDLEPAKPLLCFLLLLHHISPLFPIKYSVPVSLFLFLPSVLLCP